MNLVDMLVKVRDGEIDLKDAIKEYEIEMVKRGAEEVKASDDNAAMVHDFNMVLKSPLAKIGLKRSK